jgi:hypothetical protein
MEKKAENTDFVGIRQNGGFILMFNNMSLQAKKNTILALISL